MKPLRVGIWDSCFRHLGDPSVTHGQPLPSTLRYLDGVGDSGDVDVVLATCEDAHRVVGLDHPRRALFLQESSEGHPSTDLALYRLFDLVLTHDERVLEALPNARYLTLGGTWIRDFSTSPADKVRSVSFLAKLHPGLSQSGYGVRDAVARQLTGFDPFGSLFGLPALPSKDPTLRPYRFSIIIENTNRRWWWTEKLGDAFATRTVPLYWGCSGDLSRLAASGFDPRGIMPWLTLEGLKERLHMIERHGEAIYQDLAGPIDHNWRRIQEVPSTEHEMERVLREFFGLGGEDAG